MAELMRSTGSSRIDPGVAIVVLTGLALLLGLLVPGYRRERMRDNITRCADNLSAMGKAMAVYADDYGGALPVAGARGTRWTGQLRDWSAADRSSAFGLDPNGGRGEATVSSSLYLLVRYMQLDPKSFVCPVDKATRRFRPEKYGASNAGPASLWDFGPDPTRHCSYAYQMVYSPYKLTTPGDHEFAVAADRNPWTNERNAADFPQFVPDLVPSRGTLEQARYSNALAHDSIGQNVLFLDIAVQFKMRPFCGLERDNIYTSWDGNDRVRGKPPKLGSQPADAKDSLLVNDPPRLTAGRLE